MTDNTGDLEQYIAAGKIVLKKQADAGLTALAKELVEPGHLVPVEAPSTRPALPKPMELTKEVREALIAFPTVFGQVTLEKEAILTDEQHVALHEENEVLKVLETLVASRREHIKDYVRHDMDLEAERDERAGSGTEKDAKGFYVLAAPQNPERRNIPGSGKEWSREYRAGSVTVDPSVVQAMYDADELTRDEYLSMTREVRVFDEAKFRSALAKKPELFKVLRRMTKIGLPSTSFFTRKAK